MTTSAPKKPSLLDQPDPGLVLPPPPVVELRGGGGKWSRRSARAYLESCPTRVYLIERTSDDREYERRTGKPIHEVVFWNGWAYPVPKGRAVELPEPIVQILEQSAQIFRTDQARDASATLQTLTGPNDLGHEVGS